MTSADRPEQITALRSIRLSWAPTPDDVWQPQAELHVPGMHERALTQTLDALNDARGSEDSSPLGVVITGPPGTGKTHLLAQAREATQADGGYFFLIGLLDGKSFWRSILIGLLDDLMRPAPGHPSQHAKLLAELAEVAGVDEETRRAVLGTDMITPSTLDTFVSAVFAQRPRYRRRAQHALRALVLWAAPDPLVQELGDAYLQAISDVEPTEFAPWGIRQAELGYQGIAEALSRLMSITGPTMLAIDQIDTLLAQSRSSARAGDSDDGQDRLLEEVAHGLMSLRQTMTRTVSVVSVLPGAWDSIETHAVGSVPDRFRIAPMLESIPDAEIGRSILARRFALSYADIGFTPPYPTWPITLAAFDAAPDHTPRRLMILADRHIRACIDRGSVDELTDFDDTTSESLAGPIATDSPAMAAFDARFAELSRTFDIDSALAEENEDREFPALLAAGFSAWISERPRLRETFTYDPSQSSSPPLHGRLKCDLDEFDNQQHWAFRAVASQNARAALNRIQKASAAVGLTAGVPQRGITLIRNTAWSKGAKTQETVAEFQAAGGRIRAISRDDVATLGALRALLVESPAGLGDWLATRRPAHGVELFAQTLPGIDDHPTAAAAPIPPARPASPEPAPTPVVPIDADSVPPENATEQPAAHPEPPVRQPVSSSGEIIVGTAVSSGRDVGVSLEALRKHVAIFAGSGSGKTVLIRRLIEECAVAGVSSIVLDVNNDLARLGQQWPEGSREWPPRDRQLADDYFANTEVLVWTPRRSAGRPLSFQPLPDFTSALTDADEFDAAVESALASLEPQTVGGGAKAKHAQAVLRQAVEHFGRGGGGSLSALVALLEDFPPGASKLRNAVGIAADLAENLKAAIANDPMFGGTGTPVDPGVLLTPSPGKRARVSVINLAGLTADEAKRNFVNQLQMGLFAWIKKNPAGDRPLGGLLVMDEAQNFAPSGTVITSTRSTLALASQARKYGLGLIYATQAPKGIDNKIAGNAATQFYGLLNSPAQISAAQEYAKAKGGTLADIARLPSGRFYAAIEGGGFTQVQTPLCVSYHPKSPPTEEEVIAIARG